MSSDDNVKTVQSIYEAFGRGDLPAILDAVTDDVDWASDAGVAPRCHGGARAHGKARGRRTSSCSSPRPRSWTSSRRW